jgi:glutaredoxin
MRHVVLYTRPGCCLCDTARDVLTSVGARHPDLFDLEERDIETDDALLRAYLERIPVIAIDGEEAFELSVDERALKQRLGIVQTR